jgi:hypothetical protein
MNRQLLVVLLVALHCAMHVGAEDKPIDSKSVPPRSFATAEALRNWGASSAWGGGIVSEPYKLGEHTVYVATRQHTSGRATAEVSLYTVDQDGKGLSLALFVPTRVMAISSRLDGDAIVFESRDGTTGKSVTVLTITRHLLDFRAL